MKSRWRFELLDEFRLLAMRPRIVGEAEANAIRDGGVVVDEKNLQARRVGIGEVDAAENVERLRADLAGVGGQAVGDFEGVLVGLVFDIAGKSVADGTTECGDDRKQQEQCRERSPIIECPDAPLLAPADKHPVNQAVTY